jgi:hypothetical protein
MENIPISLDGNRIIVDGFPDAVKVFSLNGPESKRLADLALHRHDLEFALGCLEVLAEGAIQGSFQQIALWQAAIVNYVKCFGKSSSRFSLDFKTVFRNEPDAHEPHQYFKSLRDKHVVHDENSYAEMRAGAVLNGPDSQSKIAKIVCFGAFGVGIEDDNYSNLMLLTSHSLRWVVNEFDVLCNRITDQLEQLPYENLLSQKMMAYHPRLSAEDVHKNRN